MDAGENEAVIPIVSEELHARTVPIQTGGVRVIKRRSTHDETIEQELRKGGAEVKRVKTHRLVDGPQPVRREGNVTVVPVVSEVLKIERQFVLTEEIYITQTEESETFRQTVSLHHEEARIERFESAGSGEEPVPPPVE